jgi:hypothetical protein
MNPHSAYIDMQISKLEKSPKWSGYIMDTHSGIIRDYSTCVFTNVTHSTFTKSYMKKHPCSDCGANSSERCHGKGEERPVLIRRALEKCYPDTSVMIQMKTIIIAYFEEHKNTKFTFKCKKCHLAEEK